MVSKARPSAPCSLIDFSSSHATSPSVTPGATVAVTDSSALSVTSTAFDRTLSSSRSFTALILSTSSLVSTRVRSGESSCSSIAFLKAEWTATETSLASKPIRLTPVSVASSGSHFHPWPAVIRSTLYPGDCLSACSVYRKSVTSTWPSSLIRRYPAEPVKPDR